MAAMMGWWDRSAQSITYQISDLVSYLEFKKPVYISKYILRSGSGAMKTVQYHKDNTSVKVLKRI